MNDLEKGKYRYTITDPDPLITGNCASKPYAFKQGVIEVEDDKWKGIVLHQPGTRATAEEINEPTETRTDIQDPGNKD